MMTTRDHATPHTPERILRRRAVIDRVGLSATTIWRLVRAQRFPAPIRLSDYAVGWREADIEAWIQSRSTVQHRPTDPSTDKAA